MNMEFKEVQILSEGLMSILLYKFSIKSLKATPPPPNSIWSSQARDQIWAAVATYTSATAVWAAAMWDPLNLCA